MKCFNDGFLVSLKNYKNLLRGILKDKIIFKKKHL